jgi:hypothetical protein
MATFNFKVLNMIVEKPIVRACRQKAKAIAQEKFDDARNEFFSEFESDETTQELQAGARMDTGSLAASGNIIGFLGIDADEGDPYENLSEFLNENILLEKEPYYNGAKKQYEFKVFIPNKKSFEKEKVFQMAWGTAKTWVFAIENGISGLNHYLFFKDKPYGRSTGGIQTKGEIPGRSEDYTPRRYMSELLNSLKKNIES